MLPGVAVRAQAGGCHAREARGAEPVYYPVEGSPGAAPRWSIGVVTRRAFLLGALALLPGRPARVAAAETRQSPYEVDVGILYDLLRFHLTGTITESIDRERGRYEVSVRGQGDGIQNQSESVGVLRGGRWVPRKSVFRVVVYGREAHLDVTYDQDARLIRYRGRSETFFLRRLRVAEDDVPVPPDVHVDDIATALLNYADGLWRPGADGRLTTHVVRRRRAANEGADDVQKRYEAELVPLVLTVEPDPRSPLSAAVFDLSRFSSWAREDRPARIVFGADRRPRTLTSSLILGTSLAVRVGGGA